MKRNGLIKMSAILMMILMFSLRASSQVITLNCDFTVAAHACVQQEVPVTYTGGAPASADYLWEFDGGIIDSGSGQGPYMIRWETPGEKHLSLTINWEGQTCTAYRTNVVFARPEAFHMTGGGILVPGGDGVEVGLSGSQAGIVYKLRLNGQYTGTTVIGTGLEISFGLQTVPGNYTAVARVDGSECLREMEGVAVITTAIPPPHQNICMVTFDTASSLNKVIWNKNPGEHLAYYSIYRETYQNNVFNKIAEVPQTSLSVYVDLGSAPLVKSYRYKISVTDSAQVESEKSSAHKTIHLNVNPGIYGYNLIWNHYEGFEYLTYRIHRKYGGGSWEVIDSVASNTDSYTDFYTTLGLTYYYIEVMRLEPCHPSLKSDGYLSVNSNIAASSPLGTEESETGSILVYPNPVHDKLRVSIPGHSVFKLQVLRPDGSIVYENMIKEPTTELDISDFSAGLYLVKLTGENSANVQKVLKY